MIGEKDTLYHGWIVVGLSGGILLLHLSTVFIRVGIIIYDLIKKYCKKR
jgi:hypothetical protein